MNTAIALFEALHAPQVLPYSGYFAGVKIFVVFVVETRTTKFLPTKHRIVPGGGLEYRDHENCSTNLPKIQILPLEKYPLYGKLIRSFRTRAYSVTGS